MKVIGRVGKTDYLLSATVEEIAALANTNITHKEEANYGYYSKCDAVKVGTEFNIKAAWSQIHRNDKRKGEVFTVRRQLEAIIAQLDMIEPFLAEPAPEVEAASAGQ
jgi:hypothetical protein